MNRRSRIFAVLLALCVPAASIGAEGSAQAKRWLDLSDAAATSLQPSGVYASYALTRLRLAQARAYALQGDIDNTRSHLPYKDDRRPEWSSGGDGMVRSLLVSLDLEEIHASLLQVLSDAGRADDAYGYVAGLDTAQGSEAVWLALGNALGSAGETQQRSGLTSLQQAMVKAGRAQALLEGNRPNAARDLIATIDPEASRVQATSILASRLIAEQELVAVARLLVLKVLPEARTSALATEALHFALREKDLETATVLTELVDEPVGRDGLDAYLAFVMAGGDQQTRAAEIFDQAKLRQAPMWEQVAVRLNRDAWLEAHYLAIASPWRRTERLYYYAIRKLEAGENGEGDRIAALATKSAEEIPAGSTRWLAFEMLAGYYAKAGDPKATAARAAEIPAATPDAKREHSKAVAAVVEAWARAGDPARALREAEQIEDPLFRAAGLLAAAEATYAEDQNAYRQLVLAGEQNLRSVEATRLPKQQGGWAKLVTMQCRIGDLAGANDTAARATEAGDGGAAYAAIVKFMIDAKDLDAAQQAAGSVPAGTEPSSGLDRRARALAQVTEALAAKGHGRRAAALLAQIEQKHLRELATAPVAAALIAQGEQAKAIELAIALKRDDARERALGVVLRAFAEQELLPDGELLMRRVPNRGGGELCWAAAATATADPQRLEAWLKRIDNPSCQSFAYAGAAYAALAAATDVEPAKLFARLDPARNEARMAEAMQKSAGARGR